MNVLNNISLNDMLNAGMDSFISVIQPRVSQAYGEDPSRYPRAYTSTRGILIEKRYLDRTPLDLSRGHYFQFNPKTVSDVKSTLYEIRDYTGLSYNDYIWTGGGERIISFQLFLDNTPQSKYTAFRPESYGSHKANEIDGANKGFSYDNSGRITGADTGKQYFGKQLVDSAVGTYKGVVEGFSQVFLPKRGPSQLQMTSGAAFSNSRVDERGILPEVEKIQSLLHPATLEGESTPLFAEGGIVSSMQFRPPPVVVLALGPLYLEGVVKSAPVNYTLFDTDLTPIRGTIDIDFAVFEFESITRQTDWKAR